MLACFCQSKSAVSHTEPVVELCLGFASGHCLGMQENLLLPPLYYPFCPQPPVLNFAINSLSVSLIAACTHCIILLCTDITWIHHRKDQGTLLEPTVQLFLPGKVIHSSKGGLMFEFLFFSLLFQQISFNLSYHRVWMHTLLALLPSKLFLPT